jgi:hypothetical protein
LRNGLFKALLPALDDQVDLQTVNKVKKGEIGKDGFFRKIFGKPGGKETEKE